MNLKTKNRIAFQQEVIDMKMSRYRKAVILRVVFVVAVAVLGVMVFLGSGCTMVPKRTVSDPIQEVHDLVAQKINEARINAKTTPVLLKAGLYLR